MKKQKIYVSGPFTIGDQEANIKKALEVAEKIISLGDIPVVPHLTELWHRHYPHEHQFWVDYDLEFLRDCDAMIRIPGESKGAELEEKFAKENKIPIYYIETRKWDFEHEDNGDKQDN